ncbi:uncharacterized protein [Diadema setosum]|uniref:uncharacterized protein n=1 Tax=Diadema setosum TaxID=31175 RepID=UPI003B3B9306
MAQKFVEAEIRDNKVVVFSKTYCPFCTMAKTALKDAGLENYKLIELDSHSMGAQIQDCLNEITGARTVPRVFIGGKCVGGGTEVKQLQNSGQLVTILKECGAL